MKKLCYLIASASTAMMLCAGAFSCTNEEEPWKEEEYQTLANCKMTRSAEIMCPTTLIVLDIPGKLYAFKGMRVKCTGYAAGVYREGIVTFAGSIEEDTIPNHYLWEVHDVTCDMPHIGNIRVIISNISHDRCYFYADYLGSATIDDPYIGGVSFSGNRAVTYYNYHDEL